MNRTTEFVLGLIGGIFGIVAAIMAIFVGGIGEAFGAEGSGGITAAGWIAVLLSVLGSLAPHWYGVVLNLGVFSCL